MQIKEFGHVVLYVSNLEKSAHFYGDVLGWIEVARTPYRGIMYSSGRTHHELFLIELGNDATPLPQGNHLGLYHIAFKVGDTDEELREALQIVKEEGIPIVRLADHAVTHSLYVLDPDGNQIELYVDVDSNWREHPEAIASGTKALKL